MGDLLGGSRVLAMDYPPTVQVFDATRIDNTNIPTSYGPLTPEVGVTFMAPTTGRVMVTIGGGVRNNAANNDRIFLAPQIFLGTNNTGTEVLAPSAPQYGISSRGGYTTEGFRLLSRTALVTGLTAGSTYYVRVMAIQINHAGATSSTSDVEERHLIVAPAT